MIANHKTKQAAMSDLVRNQLLLIYPNIKIHKVMTQSTPSRSPIISVHRAASGNKLNEKNVNQCDSPRRTKGRACRWTKTI